MHLTWPFECSEVHRFWRHPTKTWAPSLMMPPEIGSWTSAGAQWWDREGNGCQGRVLGGVEDERIFKHCDFCWDNTQHQRIARVLPWGVAVLFLWRTFVKCASFGGFNQDSTSLSSNVLTGFAHFFPGDRSKLLCHTGDRGGQQQKWGHKKQTLRSLERMRLAYAWCLGWWDHSFWDGSWFQNCPACKGNSFIGLPTG